jgi:hypothetical protein
MSDISLQNPPHCLLFTMVPLPSPWIGTSPNSADNRNYFHCLLLSPETLKSMCRSGNWGSWLRILYPRSPVSGRRRISMWNIKFGLVKFIWLVICLLDDLFERNLPYSKNKLTETKGLVHKARWRGQDENGGSSETAINLIAIFLTWEIPLLQTE